MPSSFPIKAHYAMQAMLALAEKHEDREPLPARQIARDQQIPSQFLTQILQLLRTAHLVSSTRGANGGFLLERSPDNVTLAEVVDAVCPSTQRDACVEQGESPGKLSHVMNEVWLELEQQQRAVMESLTLSELLTRARESAPMFYI
ncbi:MAG: Rrf2 family transcriptional regulator [Pirellulaceae bacterium]